MPQPDTAAAGRRLRQRTRVVVYRRSASPGAISTPETPAVGRSAARLCRAGRGTKWSGPACSDWSAVKRPGQYAWLVDRMTPFDNAPFHGRRPAGAIWLAFVALLGNVLLPAALSIIVLKEVGRSVPGGICGQWPGDVPGKAKPGLLVQHCPLCTVPVAPLPRSPDFAIPREVASESQPRPLRNISVASIRHGRIQARAPPSAV
jgi:hypothetical protein